MRSLTSKEISSYLGANLDQLHLLVLCIDSGGKILYANAHFLSLTGFTFDEAVGKSLYDTFVPVNKIETVAQKYSLIINNRYSMESEHPVLKKDGSQIIVAWHNVPIKLDADSYGVISIGSDITSRVEIELLLSLNEKTMRERAEIYEKQNRILEDTKVGMLNLLDDAKRLEEELQYQKKNIENTVQQRTHELNEEKARLVAAINSFPYGFLVLNSEDRVVMVNEKLETIFSVRRIEWQLKDLDESLGEAAGFMSNYKKVKTEKKPVLIKEIDLERRFLDVYIAPIFLNPLSLETIGHIILVNDITEQKIIEKSKDEFFSIASHELRTPLTAIRGNAELIKKYYAGKIEDNTFVEMLGDIQSSSERLIDLVNEFLNMSKLEQGKMQFVKENVDICELISGVIAELTSTAQNKGLYLNFESKVSGTPKVYADFNKLKEVAINLISNALAYTDEGGCTVTVEINMDQVKVSVSDTGKGIPPQNQNLLFRKFQQANYNLYTRDVAKSTGLGLYISKLIIGALNGSIYLESSKVGEGSTFVFTLPVAGS